MRSGAGRAGFTPLSVGNAGEETRSAFLPLGGATWEDRELVDAAVMVEATSAEVGGGENNSENKKEEAEEEAKRGSKRRKEASYCCTAFFTRSRIHCPIIGDASPLVSGGCGA